MGNCLASPVADEPRSSRPATPGGSSGGGAAAAAAQPVAVSPPKPSSKEAEVVEKRRAMHKRIAVAAEAITNAADIAIPDVPKTE